MKALKLPKTVKALLTALAKAPSVSVPRRSMAHRAALTLEATGIVRIGAVDDGHVPVTIIHTIKL